MTCMSYRLPTIFMNLIRTGFRFLRLTLACSSVVSMTRSVIWCITFVAAFSLARESALYAQDSTSGSQDTSYGGALRPRRETYIIEPFPSPALASQQINIAYYNHNPEETSLRIVDILDRTVIDLQPRQFIENGVHSHTIEPGKLAGGAYFIRLTTYTSTGSQKQVQDLRFIVIR